MDSLHSGSVVDISDKHSVYSLQSHNTTLIDLLAEYHDT